MSPIIIIIVIYTLYMHDNFSTHFDTESVGIGLYAGQAESHL